VVRLGSCWAGVMLGLHLLEPAFAADTTAAGAAGTPDPLTVALHVMGTSGNAAAPSVTAADASDAAFTESIHMLYQQTQQLSDTAFLPL